MALLDEVAAGAYRLAGFDVAAVGQVAAVIRQYADVQRWPTRRWWCWPTGTTPT